MTELVGEARRVYETLVRIKAAFDERNVEALLAAHCPAPEASLISAGTRDRVTGWEAVRQRLESQVGEHRQCHTELRAVEVAILGDVAIAVYWQRIQAILHDIDFRWTGWVTDVFVKRQDEWLLLHHHASDRSED